ncbi:hypothetical protein [Streptomyces sp. NPDC046832]|uniref:hypothetical protein n=1 Tax=Streptomyces sp. NPDC046832 TaxID=3155020 RepID=UPI0033E0DEF7
MDMAAKEAAIDRFLRAYPHVIAAGREHPALHGCEEVRWSEFAECPAAIPVLLYGLVDQAAAAEAQRVLTNTLSPSWGERRRARSPAVPAAPRR